MVRNGYLQIAKKTESASKIPILQVTQMIIDKYADYPQCNNQDKRLPILSNQKMNSSLKEIADVCSIEKELTFHIARHIFATTVTFPNHIPSTSFLPFRLSLTVK